MLTWSWGRRVGGPDQRICQVCYRKKCELSKVSINWQFWYPVRTAIRNLTAHSRAQERAVEGDPLVYIVAVLLFYSAGMAALLINYMKKVTHNSMNGLDYTADMSEVAWPFLMDWCHPANRSVMERVCLQCLIAAWGGWALSMDGSTVHLEPFWVVGGE